MNIYQYYSAQKLVQDLFAQKTAKNPSYSVRAWARNLGFKSHTVLHAVVKGTKLVPLSFYVPLVRDLELNAQESHFLLLLINLEAAKDQYSRLMLLDQVDLIKKNKRFKMAEMADFSLLSDPFWGFLIELTDRADFQSDVAWIKAQSRIPKSSQEIRSIIDTLLKRGILTEDNGRLRKTNQHITNVHDLANIGSRLYHRNCSLLAAEQLELQPVDEREFNSYALNIRARDMAKMKERMRTFMKDFIVEFEAGPGEGDRTYQLSSQLFNLSRRS